MLIDLRDGPLDNYRVDIRPGFGGDLLVRFETIPPIRCFRLQPDDVVVQPTKRNIGEAVYRLTDNESGIASFVQIADDKYHVGRACLAIEMVNLIAPSTP